MAVAVVTICSKKKRTDPHDLPARERYVGSHIALVEAQARERGCPFYILSAQYGLLAPDQPIPNYDHELHENELDELAYQVGRQLEGANVHEVHLFLKAKPAWSLYRRLMHFAAAGKAAVIVHPLADNL